MLGQQGQAQATKHRQSTLSQLCSPMQLQSLKRESECSTSCLLCEAPYLLLAYSCLCQPAAAASGCLHTCSLPKPWTSTVVALLSGVAKARCAAHLLSTDVYAKCHILYLSCLNCSSLFLYFYTMAAVAAAPPSLPAADPLSFSTSRHFTIFFVEFLIMHTRWSHIHLKAALFLPCACFFKFHPPFFLKKKNHN